MRKYTLYFFGLLTFILSFILISSIISNNIQEEISKIKEEKSKDLVLKSFKTQAQNTDYNYLNVQRPDFVEIAKKSINTVVHVKRSSSGSDYNIEDFIFGFDRALLVRLRLRLQVCAHLSTYGKALLASVTNPNRKSELTQSDRTLASSDLCNPACRIA